MAEKTAKAPRKPASSRKRVVKPDPKAQRDEIARRAYYISLDEGSGDDVANWLRAEREISQAA